MIRLGDIEKPQGLTQLEHEQILSFMGGLIKNKSGITDTEGLFDPMEGGEFQTKVLDATYAKKFLLEDHTIVELETKAMAKYMCGDTIEVKLLGYGKPLSATKKSLKDYKNLLQTHYLFPFFKDKGEVGDSILYMWFDLFKHINIQKMTLNGEGLNMYFGGVSDMFRKLSRQGTVISEYSFDYYLGFSRDKFLDKEISLGYTNKHKLIGDPNRDYAYTHLLRQNAAQVGKVYPASAMRLIMNWSWFNCYVTSRKQGKTSFAADRIVAELLNEKKGYGRNNRKIKFFIDNAGTIGAELMDFIDEIIFPFKDKEISPGVKAFTVYKNDQKIVCNITGNIFSVVSLYGIGSKNNKSTGEGLACDCAVIDEGFRLPDKFWKSFRTRAREETEWILFLSTLNEETEPTHWGYGEMIKGEAGAYPTHNTVRSSEFDNTVTYMLKFHIKRQKSPLYTKDITALKQYEKYIWENFYEEKEEFDEDYVLKRFLCGISTEDGLFDTTGRIIHYGESTRKTDLRIIGLDMGGLEDQLGVVVFNPATLIVEEGYGEKVESKNYADVLVKIKEIKEVYPNSMMIGDLGGPVGNTIFALDTEKIVNYWIKNDGNVEQLNDHGHYYVINKGVLVLSGAHVLSSIVKIMGTCVGLIKGFGNMIKKKSKSGKTMLYMGRKGRKDDSVFGFLLIFGFLIQVQGLRTGEDIKEFAKEFSDYGEYEVFEYDTFGEEEYSTGINY